MEVLFDAGYVVNGRVDGARMQCSAMATCQSSQQEGKTAYRGAESATKVDTQREDEHWRWKERGKRAIREGAEECRRRERQAL